MNKLVADSLCQAFSYYEEHMDFALIYDLLADDDAVERSEVLRQSG